MILSLEWKENDPLLVKDVVDYSGQKKRIDGVVAVAVGFVDS
jgi:hypothetical protein